MSDKGLIFRIYEELIQLNSKETNNLIKKWAEDLKTFFQKRQTDGQQAHEKCSTLPIMREIQVKTEMRYHLTLVRTAIIKKQVLVRMWSQGNPRALLVEMQTGAATM